MAVGLDLIQSLLVVVAFLLGLAVVHRLDRPRGRWGEHLRTRFVLSIPWGTVVTTIGVLSVYLFLQGGLRHWFTPIVIPFRAWSYFYPIGILTAAFSHVGPGHLLGNLTTTLAIAPIVEYAWGHFPRRRGASSFGSLWTNPYVRAFVLFPAGVVAVGFLTSVFAIGPVIGFSGVVFAFAGFALVRYPYATLIAVFVSRAFDPIRLALLDPILVAKARPIFYTPWWASIAIQGHALGILIGVLLGSYWLMRHEDQTGRPSALRLWSGVFLFAVAQSLWAIYWYRGGTTYVLYRGLGIVLVTLLATLVASGIRASNRSLIPADIVSDGRLALLSLFGAGAALVVFWLGGGHPWLPVAGYWVSLPAVLGGVFLIVALVLAIRRPRVSIPIPLRTTPRRYAALFALLLGTAAIAGPAIPVNLVTVSGDEMPGDEVQVREYQITYAENVPNGMVSAIDVSAFGETTQVNTSGVIVRNRERGIWTTAVTKGKLQFDGNVTVRVGGVGWRDSLVASRRGWVATGGNRVYRVRLVHDGTVKSTFTSEPAVVQPTIAHRNISLVATDTSFVIAVFHNNTTVHRPVPQKNASVTALGIEFVRKKAAVVAVHNGTRVEIARKETYQ